MALSPNLSEQDIIAMVRPQPYGCGWVLEVDRDTLLRAERAGVLFSVPIRKSCMQCGHAKWIGGLANLAAASVCPGCGNELDEDHKVYDLPALLTPATR